VVHRAIERSTGRNWVAKFVACTTIERAMVRQEIDIRNDLRHPNLLQLHEAFETDGEMAFILEL
jgi:serine/threonine protein kinase